MKNILVITEPTAHAASWVRTVLAPHGNCQVSAVSRQQLQNSKLFQESRFDFIVFDCEWLDQPEVNYLQTLSHQTEQTPVIVLARQISIYSYGQVHALCNTIALQTPSDPKVFLAVVHRITANEEVKSPVCPRFITNLPLRILVLGNGVYLPTRLRNYSATGAFLEYHGINLKVGDRIQINLGPMRGFSHKGTSFLKEARVVWIRDGENARSPARGVGVQFL